MMLFGKIPTISPSVLLGGWLLLLVAANPTVGQQTQEVNPQFGRGNLINDVRIILLRDSVQTPATSSELRDFYEAFFIVPGTTFNPLTADLALSRIVREDRVEDAYYKLYDAETGSGTLNRPLSLVIYVEMKPKGEASVEKGMLTSRRLIDFPVIYESGRSQFKFLVNGGAGIYNDENALFGQGAAFTRGNPVADNPADEGSRFWGEAFVEPGITGISKLGNSSIYWYGEASVLASGRNTDDIYSSGATAFIGVERLYTGFLAAGLGTNRNITINASYGRNFFQLNDGFLFSRFSGSSNAGERGSVYTSARTTFQKNGNLSVQWKNLRLSTHFLEPQELFDDRQLNTNYVVSTFNYNNNKNLDVGVSYVATTGGRATYRTPEGTLEKQGMYVINPKLWLYNIAETGLFFKSEYAYQSHTNEDMRSRAWYAGLGYSLNSLRTTPSVYYRYAYMQGDDPATQRYERFDPILTGGLGNWVQGLNFRKVSGNGNIVSHRIEVVSWVTRSMSLSFDYFYLRADTQNNLGGLPPIADLPSREIGHEVSATLKGLVRDHLTLLGIVSYSVPGEGFQANFASDLPDWLTAQVAVFINF